MAKFKHEYEIPIRVAFFLLSSAGVAGFVYGFWWNTCDKSEEVKKDQLYVGVSGLVAWVIFGGLSLIWSPGPNPENISSKIHPDTENPNNANKRFHENNIIDNKNLAATPLQIDLGPSTENKILIIPIKTTIPTTLRRRQINFESIGTDSAGLTRTNTLCNDSPFSKKRATKLFFSDERQKNESDQGKNSISTKGFFN